MLSVTTYGMCWALDGDQVLVWISPSGIRSWSHTKPLSLFITLVLVALDEIPPENEVLGDVKNTLPYKTHRYVMPRHSTELGLVQLVLRPVRHCVEIHDTIVVVVLTRKDFILHAGGVDISKTVLTGIPSAVAKIQSSNEGEMVINDDEFLVVRPVECHIAHVLEDIVVRMSKDMNVAMTRSTFRTQEPQRMFGVSRVARESLLDLFVDNDIDLNTTFSSTLNGLVQPPFLVEVWWTAEEELRR